MRLRPLLVAALAAWVAGCAPLNVATTAGGAVLEERSAADQAADMRIRLAANARLAEADSKLFRAVGLQVWEGRTVLTGAVADPAHKAEAERIMRAVAGVRAVHNEIQVTNEGGLAAFAGDTVIEGKVQARLLGDAEIRSVNYSVRAVNGTVYLIGIARTAAELERVKAHAKNVDGVKRVVSYIRLR